MGGLSLPQIPAPIRPAQPYEVAPVQAENPLAQYQRLMQLKNEQAMQPLQQQAAQQSVQAGAIDLQKKQQELKDQQAMSMAMQQWGKPAGGQSDAQSAQSSASQQGSSPAPTQPEGQGAEASTGGQPPNPKPAMPSYEDLVPLAIKNGASFQAVQGLQAHILDMKTKAATIAMDDARTGASNADALKTKNGMVVQALTGVLSQPDEQLAPALMQTAQQLGQQGLIDPQYMQMAEQIAQSGDPAKIRQSVDMFAKSVGGNTQILEAAQKNISNQKGQEENQFYQQNGGAPGVPAEMMQQAAWLKKNPGKDASDYKLWTLQHTPNAMVMNNQLGGPQNADALDLAANNYRLTGQMPAGLARSPQTITAIIARAAQIDQQSGGNGIAANKGILQANTDSLKKLQTNFDQVQAFEATAQKNMDLLQQTAQKIPDLGSRFANVPVRMLNSQMLGTDNMAAFKTALNTAQTEAAKVLNSSNASGILSDSARHELQSIIDGNMPYSAMVASLNTLKQDMGNRTQSYQMQIQDIQTRIKGSGNGQQPTAQPNQPQGQPAPAKGDPFAQFGGVAH